MREDKQAICDALLLALQKTSYLHDLVSLKYERVGKYDEYVTATFECGHQKKVNVSIDSGSAMILDIVRHIV